MNVQMHSWWKIGFCMHGLTSLPILKMDLLVQHDGREQKIEVYEWNLEESVLKISSKIMSSLLLGRCALLQWRIWQLFYNILTSKQSQHSSLHGSSKVGNKTEPSPSLDLTYCCGSSLWREFGFLKVATEMLLCGLCVTGSSEINNIKIVVLEIVCCQLKQSRGINLSYFLLLLTSRYSLPKWKCFYRTVMPKLPHLCGKKNI